ncbi:MAG: beta-galactosidase, partial [Armatimonadota bacterium]
INRVLAESGVDTIDNVGVTQSDGPTMATVCRNAAWRNLRSVPYITRIASMQMTGLVRRPCLTDPEHLSAWLASLRERAAAAAPYGPPAYTLGDENFLVRTKLDVCSSPTCLARFREYLQETYGDLAALNAEWDTELKSWDEATPITLDEATETKQYARWADHRRYMDRVFTEAHALARDVIREADPGARVGFDGVFSLDSWHGYDFYQLVRASDLSQVYARRFNQIEYLRSFHGSDTLLGAWHNRIGNDDEISAKRVAWHLLFHGFNSGWYWTSYNTGPAALFPDLRPTPQLRWLAESHGEIKSGIGKLLMNAERLHDGIAIHYSQASVHGNTLLGRQLPEAHWGALLAIEDLGLQYDFVSSPQIERGALEDYRAFVMPASCAVSAKELAAIRAFVERGGLLIADILPAVMDGRCKPLEQGALDDVFGETVSADVTATMPDADVPPLTPNAFGRGRALLLGFPLGDYRDLRTAGSEAAFREALRAVLASRGIEAQVRVLSDGEPLSACEVVRFR